MTLAACATVPRLCISAAHRASPEGSTLAAAQRGCALCGRVSMRRHSRHCSLQCAVLLRTRSRFGRSVSERPLQADECRDRSDKASFHSWQPSPARHVTNNQTSSLCVGHGMRAPSSARRGFRAFCDRNSTIALPQTAKCGSLNRSTCAPSRAWVGSVGLLAGAASSSTLGTRPRHGRREPVKAGATERQERARTRRRQGSLDGKQPCRRVRASLCGVDRVPRAS